MTLSKILIYSLAISTSACVRAPGTHPNDMSASNHEAAAAHEEGLSHDHAAHQNPASSQKAADCTSTRGRVCWTESPADTHAEMARDHRELAAKHRAASQALRDAEIQACAGLSDEDRDTSPFDHTADIKSVSKLHDKLPARAAKVESVRAVGATVTLNAVPGLTVEWLQRIVDCHLARNAAVGGDMPEMPVCPLVPAGTKATVRSVGNGFAVDLRSDDPAVAEEIWRRAEALTAH